MEVYEVGFKSMTAVIWIATDHKIISTKRDKDIYIKDIPEYDEDTPGIDFIIK